jgi:hypothetical protein
MKPPIHTLITFKTKARQMHVNGDKAPHIKYKRKVSRRDCGLKPHQHDYYNSDMFPSMLQQRAYDNAIGAREWEYLDRLPETVHIDASGFLAAVTVRVEV